MSIAEKLRQAYHNDLTDVPLLIDAAEEIERLERECHALQLALLNVRDWDQLYDAMPDRLAAVVRTALEAKP